MTNPLRFRKMILSVMALCLLTAVVGPIASAADARYLSEKQNTVIFPIKNGLPADKAQLADDLLVMLKDGLSLTSRFMVVACDVDSNVSVQRAVAEQKIKAEDLKSAFATDPQGVARAKKVCQAIATDLGIVGSIDSYTFSETNKEVKIAVTVQVVRGNPDVEPTTIAVTGIAAGKPDDQSQTESGIAVGALDDAADKILSKLLDVAKVNVSPGAVGDDQQVYVPAGKSKSHSKGIVPAMLGALLLGLLLGGK